MTKEEIEKEADILYPNANVINHEATEYDGFVKGALWIQEFFEDNRVTHCSGMTKDECEREMEFVSKFIKEHNRTPTYSDAIEMTIDKACKTFCRFCPHQCEGYPHDDCQVQIEFRNALGE